MPPILPTQFLAPFGGTRTVSGGDVFGDLIDYDKLKAESLRSEEEEEKKRRQERIRVAKEQATKLRREAEAPSIFGAPLSAFVQEFGKNMAMMGREVAKAPIRPIFSLAQAVRGITTSEELVEEKPTTLPILGEMSTYQRLATQRFYGYFVEGKDTERVALVKAIATTIPEIALDVLAMMGVAEAVWKIAPRLTGHPTSEIISQIIPGSVKEVAKDVLKKPGLSPQAERALIKLARPVRVPGAGILSRPIPGTSRLPGIFRDGARKGEAATPSVSTEIRISQAIDDIGRAERPTLDITAPKVRAKIDVSTPTAPKETFALSPELEQRVVFRTQELKAFLPAVSGADEAVLRNAISELEKVAQTKLVTPESTSFFRAPSIEELAKPQTILPTQAAKINFRQAFATGEEVVIPETAQRVLVRSGNRIEPGVITNVESAERVAVSVAGKNITIPMSDIRRVSPEGIGEIFGINTRYSAPRLTTETERALVGRAMEAVREGTIAKPENVRMFRFLGSLIREGKVSEEQLFSIPAFRPWKGILTPGEMATMFENQATLAGKDLAWLSLAKRELASMFPEEFARMKPTLTAWERFAYLTIKGIPNAWRLSLVSALGTAMRNLEMGLLRYGLLGVRDGITGFLKVLTRQSTIREAIEFPLEELLTVIRRIPPGQLRKMHDVLTEEPALAIKLYGTPVSDVMMGGRIARGLGIFNRTQEFFVRNLAVDGYVNYWAKLNGVVIKKYTDVPLEVWAKAIDRALEITYAKTHGLAIGKEMVRIWEKYPWIGALSYPFPRFLTNAIATNIKLSPLGFTRLLGGNALKELFSGNPTKAFDIIADASIGTVGLLTAIYIRNSEHAGERWYQIKVGDKNIDVRPFGPPLSIWMFIAEAMKDPIKMSPKDYIKGALGINRLAGTSLFVAGFLSGEEAKDMKKALTNFSAEFLGGFAQSFTTFKDFIEFFSDTEAIKRATREDVLGPIKAKIPFLSQDLPELPSPFTEETQRDIAGPLRQIGLSLSPEGNKLEREVNLLGLKGAEVRPRTGNATIDRLITERMGQWGDKISEKLESRTNYDSLGELDKKTIIKELLSDVRSEAKKQTLHEDAEQKIG